MADLFSCSYCHTIFPLVEKAAVVNIEQVRYGQNGARFPNIKMFSHDLCQSCLDRVVGMATLPVEKTQTTAIVKVKLDPPRTERMIKIPVLGLGSIEFTWKDRREKQ